MGDGNRIDITSNASQAMTRLNRFSRNRRLLEEEKERLRGYPDDQQERDRHDSQHYERPEMMSVGLSARRASFCHNDKLAQPLRRQFNHRGSSRFPCYKRPGAGPGSNPH